MDQEMSISYDDYQSKIREAENKLVEISKLEIQENLLVILTKEHEIDSFLNKVSPILSNTELPLYVLSTVLNLILTGELGTFEDSRKSVCISGRVLIDKIKSFNVDQVSFHTFQILRGYFISEESESMNLNPTFTLEHIEPYGEAPSALYKWIDANFSILTVIYDEDADD
ncbi:hypothetical protein CYY_008163 [Polysphondylium violaceum]|uniref:Uncharacterized protein n=1 Tax=Polysphondylium violaceum TaxID=133409 RepID=A0A8J4UX63_9MYCE|nr:hypothetical protein CYY_008163 [Polysphondylium violaceum]